MTPEEIRRLREDLQCTARELATTVGLEATEVVAWEQGERFPTKKMVQQLNQLRELGSTAIVRKRKAKSPIPSGVARLTDPEFWELTRKLIEHPELFNKALTLAKEYADPGAATKE